MNKRVEMTFKTKEGFIKATTAQQVSGVLYANGVRGDQLITWISHYTELRDGKGKDILSILTKHLINEKTEKGITTKVSNVIEKVPLDITVTVKNIGKQKIIQRRTGKMIRVRVPFLINGETVVDPEIWEELTEKEQEHLSVIDVWVAYDELIEWMGSQNRQPSNYVGALQQIYNRTERETNEVPEVEKIKSHVLEDVDITLTVTSKNFTHTIHFDKGSYEVCHGQIIRGFGFTLPRDEIVKGFIDGKFLYEKNAMRGHRR